MTINDLASLAGILSILICGANFVVMGIARSFWKLTFEELKKEMHYLKKDYETEKEKSVAFRHEYKGVSQNLFAHIENEIKFLSARFDSFERNVGKLEKAVENLSNTLIKLSKK